MRWLVVSAFLWTLGWAMAWASVGHCHEISFSHMEVHLEAGATQARITLPIKTLLHDEPTAFPAAEEAMLRSGALSAQARTAVGDLVLTRVRLASPSALLPLSVTGVSPAGDDIAVEAAAPAAAGDLTVEANPFPDDALHKVFVSVYRGDQLAGQFALDKQSPRATLDAPHEPLWRVIATFVGQGMHHIFIGPDHILFVIALVLLGGRLIFQIKIITAFTVAHSITLALATLDIVHLPSRLVESVIALSIVVVGLHDLWRLRKGTADQQAHYDPRALLAFVFGLVHGFGFASVLNALELPRHALAWSLAAFNVGVEIGQVCILLAIAPAVYLLRRWAPPRLAQAAFSLTACLVVAAGAVWFVQRAAGA